ncbi:MAG: hypothetical protein S4CHLAM123_07370 [Chlamydiales bacterium]|nr:hypothetical protein [Chlamydiales bacterium]
MTPQDFFSILSDETRLRCLLLLQKKAEICVCEFSHILNSIQPKISRHLAHLRKSGLVSDERRGQWVYYRLNTNLQGWVQKILATMLEDFQGLEPYCSDIEKIHAFCKKNPCG